jgi:hypothetical protein
MLAAVALLLVPAAASAGKPQAEAPQDVAPQAVSPAPASRPPKPAPKARPATKAMQKKLKPGAPDIPMPPSVLTGDGELICDISSKENGHQKLTLVTGGGLEFDVAVSPIVDGTVETAGEDKGGTYRFTSHLAKTATAKAATAKLPGVGVFDLDELETKVIVEMTRYKQPGGKGTALTFTSADMARRGIYVEFAGRGHAKNGELYAFRVNLGPPTSGKGKVTPSGPEANAGMYSKMVMVAAPVTTVVVTTTVDQLVEKK